MTREAEIVRNLSTGVCWSDGWCMGGAERAVLSWGDVRRGVMNGDLVLVGVAQYEQLVRSSRKCEEEMRG